MLQHGLLLDWETEDQSLRQGLGTYSKWEVAEIGPRELHKVLRIKQAAKARCRVSSRHCHERKENKRGRAQVAESQASNDEIGEDSHGRVALNLQGT